MKKIHLALSFVLIALAVMSVAGCGTKNNEEAYVALEIGSFDAADGGKHASEFELWSAENQNSHQDSAAPETISVTFNGKTYNGSYLRSYTTPPNLYASHRYKADGAFFTINGDTNELSTILPAWEPLMLASKSREECCAMADAIVANYIDIADYKLEITESSIHSNVIYDFHYYREVSGYRTADSLNISIDGNGNVVYFGMQMIGSFKDIEAVSVEEKNITKALDTKIRSIYQEKSDHKGYSVNHVQLVRIPDGYCALLYIIKNQFERAEVESGLTFHYGSLTHLLVPLPNDK